MSELPSRCKTAVAVIGAEEVPAGIADVAYHVAVPADAPAAVRIAADEFQKYWGLITGRRIVVTACPPEDAVCVRIGFPVNDPLFGGETDAYIVKSAGDGLEIAGKNPRSVLYGTYEFFRQRCGCRLHAKSRNIKR